MTDVLKTIEFTIRDEGNGQIPDLDAFKSLVAPPLHQYQPVGAVVVTAQVAEEITSAHKYVAYDVYPHQRHNNTERFAAARPCENSGANPLILACRFFFR
jgi:hypothetical protein